MTSTSIASRSRRSSASRDEPRLEMAGAVGHDLHDRHAVARHALRVEIGLHVAFDDPDAHAVPKPPMVRFEQRRLAGARRADDVEDEARRAPAKPSRFAAAMASFFSRTLRSIVTTLMASPASNCSSSSSSTSATESSRPPMKGAIGAAARRARWPGARPPRTRSRTPRQARIAARHIDREGRGSIVRRPGDDGLEAKARGVGLHAGQLAHPHRHAPADGARGPPGRTAGRCPARCAAIPISCIGHARV